MLLCITLIHCVNLYMTFNCDKLARDQQTSAFLPNLPCTLGPRHLSAHTQVALNHWCVHCYCRSKFYILYVLNMCHMFLKSFSYFNLNFSVSIPYPLLYTPVMHGAMYSLLSISST